MNFATRGFLIFILSSLAIARYARGQASFLQEPIQPIPDISTHDLKKAQLGRELFFERRLSRDDTVACASCHDLSTNGADHFKVAVGIGGAKGERNTPTVFNSSLNFRQFWDGRAATLEEQVTGPVEQVNEMAGTWATVLKKLGEDPHYMARFREAYGDTVSKDHVLDAIATFERTLLTPNSKFDRYLKGDASAISEFEKLGYQKFKSFGCVACHQGVNAGGNMFQTMGIMGNFFANRVENNSDLGRFAITKKAKDRHVFRVPSLRNVSRTAPYFHDGSEPTLEGAVKVMGRYQLGRDLDRDDVSAIVKFLKTLDGDLPIIEPPPLMDGDVK